MVKPSLIEGCQLFDTNLTSSLVSVFKCMNWFGMIDPNKRLVPKEDPYFPSQLPCTVAGYATQEFTKLIVLSVSALDLNTIFVAVCKDSYVVYVCGFDRNGK